VVERKPLSRLEQFTGQMHEDKPGVPGELTCLKGGPQRKNTGGGKEKKNSSQVGFKGGGK